MPQALAIRTGGRLPARALIITTTITLAIKVIVIVIVVMTVIIIIIIMIGPLGAPSAARSVTCCAFSATTCTLREEPNGGGINGGGRIRHQKCVSAPIAFKACVNAAPAHLQTKSRGISKSKVLTAAFLLQMPEVSIESYRILN